LGITYRAWDDRPPAARKQVRTQPALLDAEIFLHTGKQARIWVHAAAKKAECCILLRVFVWQRDLDRLRAFGLEQRRGERDEGVRSAVDGVIVPSLYTLLNPCNV
jgi:hypothetical protein